MIYFVQGVDGGPIKIGFTRQFRERIKQLRRILKTDLNVLGVMEGDFSIESETHRRFASHRIEKSELFIPDDEIIRFVAENCRAWTEQESQKTMPVMLSSRMVNHAKIIAGYEKSDYIDVIHDVLGPILEKLAMDCALADYEANKHLLGDPQSDAD